MSLSTASKEFFEAKYQMNPEPRDFASSSCELNRYEAIIRALGERRFSLVFEPRCFIGFLTEKLAGHRDAVVAMDTAPERRASADWRAMCLLAAR